jgi:DNA primase
MSSVIDTIKAKIDVADEIALITTLQQSGKSLKGLCPFHNERTPSFYVFRETQTWHCFGCNRGGDIFSFVQQQQGLDFREALHYLGEKAGIPASEYSDQRTDEERETSIARERLLKLNEDAALWFHQMLVHAKEAKIARDYVESRGISRETVVNFSLGYAGDHWDALSSYLLGRNYTEQELVMGGLARWREKDSQLDEHDGVYDYFRNRLIFPIRDMRGRVIGFGGRALGDGKPKYLNSPQTLLFEKNTVLYAIDMAKDAIKQVGQVVIVEGYVDAIIAHQYGTAQTVACIGSAITAKHIQQLKKLTKQVTLALDPDAAGSAATEHGIQEALKGFDRTIVPVPLAATGTPREPRGQEQQGRQRQPRGIIRLEEQVDAEINVLRLPTDEDPDELIRHDLASWLYAVAHPIPLIDYYFEVKTADLDPREPAGAAEIARRLLPVIAMISDRIKRDAYIRRLAMLIRSDERSLYNELQQVLQSQKSSAVTADFTGRTGSPAQARQHADELPASLRETRDETHTVTRNQQQSPGLDKGRSSILKWEDYLIGLLLQNPGLCSHVYGIINDGDFAGTDTRELYRLLNSIDRRDASPSLQPLEHVPSALLPTVARVTRYVESMLRLDAPLEKEAITCAFRLRRMRLLQLNMELKYLIQEASEAGDKPAERLLRQQIPDILRELRTIDTATVLQG